MRTQGPNPPSQFSLPSKGTKATSSIISSAGESAVARRSARRTTRSAGAVAPFSARSAGIDSMFAIVSRAPASRLRKAKGDRLEKILIRKIATQPVDLEDPIGKRPLLAGSSPRNDSEIEMAMRVDQPGQVLPLRRDQSRAAQCALYFRSAPTAAI